MVNETVRFVSVVLETKQKGQSQEPWPILINIYKRDVSSSRCEARCTQARRFASNNKKQTPGKMADLGKKYCVNCLADVTNLRLRCTECPDIELCPECFSAGAEIGNHRRWHGYQQVDGGRFSLWGTEAEGGWTSREEQSLLDAIEQYGFGNWVHHFLSYFSDL